MSQIQFAEDGELEKISFITDDGTTEELYVVEQTKINGVQYLLVTDSDEDEADAYIFREVSEDGENISYEPVEDEDEIAYVGKVFGELLSDDDSDV